MKRIKILFVSVCLLTMSLGSIHAQSYTLPEYTQLELDNGLRVYFMEQHEVPVISVSAILPAGAIYDGEKSGLAQLTALALKHGTRNFSKTEIDETLDYLGASVNIRASKEYVGLSSKFAAKDSEEVMTMIKELLVYPVFEPTEFDKERNKLLVELEQDKESPGSVIRSYFDEQLFGDHVYGNPLYGKIESVKKITISDVKDFYAANYIPNHSAVSIVGDFDTNQMIERVKFLFSDWSRGTVKTENLASKPIAAPKVSEVLLVNKDDAMETTFYIGSLGVARNNKDLIAIDVINTLFGGRFTSMLNSELRINSGLTYGAWSTFATYKYGGSFYMGSFTATETTEEAMDLTFEVLKKLHGNGVDEQLLTSAKNYVKGQFPPRYETTRQLSVLLTQMYWYDFDENYINDFEKNVNELTLEKAQTIIATYFPKDIFQIVMIGKAAEIEKTATKYGKVKQVDIKEQQL